MDKQFKVNFLKGSAAASVGTIVSMSFHFISFIILTRALEKEDLGIYVLILAIVQLVSLLSGLGLEISIVKFIAGGGAESKEFLFPVLILKSAMLILSGVLFYYGGALTLSIFGNDIADYFIIIPFIFFAAGLRDLFYNILQGLNYFKKFALSQSLTAAIRLALIGYIIYANELNLSNIVYIELYTAIGSAILQLFFIPFKSLLKIPRWNSYIRLLQFSFPLYMNNILTFLYDRLNIFIIGAYLNNASIALYDVAGRIPEAFQRIYQSFIVVYYPNSSKLFSQNNKDSAIQLMNRSLYFSSIIIAVLTLVSYFFSKEIITLLFSAKYSDSAFAFSLLVFNFYLRSVSNLLGYTLVSAGYSSVPVKVNLLASVISISGSFLLIPMIGFTGAVYSLLLMNITSLILFRYHLSKRNIKPDMQQTAKPVYLMILIITLSLIVPTDIIFIKLLFIILFIFFSWLWLDEVKHMFNFLTKFFKPGNLF